MSPFLTLLTLFAGWAVSVEELPLRGCILLQARATPTSTDPPQEEDTALAGLFDAKDSMQTEVDLDLEHVRAPPGSILSCTFDTRTLFDVNDPSQLFIFRGWSSVGEITNEQLSRWSSLGYFPGKVDSWSKEDYTAQNVSDDFVEAWQVLGDLSNRTGKQYWMIGGALIGALRHRSLLTKDADGDFCISQFSGQHISDAYPDATEHYLYEGAAGKVYGRFVLRDGKPFVVAYEKGGAELLIFSLNSGLKIEMERSDYKCNDAHALRLLGKGQPITLEGGTRVVVPDYPFQWLTTVEKWPTHERHQSIEMPLDKFTSCSVCEASQRSEVCSTPDVFDRSHDGLGPTRVKQYVFVFTGSARVRWSCTQANRTLSGCKPADPNVTAEGQYGDQS